MATEGDEAEYESDPEEAMLTLKMRRREASDDEEGGGEEGEKKPAARVGVGSDGESDDQGGAQVYEDEESEIDVEEEEVEEEEDDELEEEEFKGQGNGGREDVRGDVVGVEAAEVRAVTESGGEGRRSGGESPVGSVGTNQEAEEAKKDNEPFAVPTAGAFYMHDDRFQDNGSGRHRRISGGRKLWESKDNRPWIHDRFEEMNLQDVRSDKERRRSGKGHFRGRGRYRGAEHRYIRGNGTRAFDESNNQNSNFKGVRGRGPRRYEPPAKNKETPAIQDRRYGKSTDMTSRNSSSGRAPAHTSNLQPEPVLPRKNVFASSLSSASPPFYPSASSNQDVSIMQKRDALTITNRNLQPSLLSEENLSASHSTALMRGKTIVERNGLERSFMDDSVRAVSGKQSNNLQLQSSASSMPLNTRQPAQPRSQERAPTIGGHLNYHPNASLNRVNKGSVRTQIPAVQQRSVQSTFQPASRGSPQQLVQHPGSGTQASLNQSSSTNSSEAGELESPPGSSKSKIALAGRGKDSISGSGKGSFPHGGTQVIGATGSMGSHGDQSFSPTPALLPFMQFGGQHRSGLGVPAVGMALPGYVAQPQLGFGNSDMAWVPVLAGAAGALGASYCPPYIAVDGGYYNRSSGQSSSLGGFKETGANKPNNILKSPQTTELASDEFGQRQNKPRRYSEMNFGQ